MLIKIKVITGSNKVNNLGNSLSNLRGIVASAVINSPFADSEIKALRKQHGPIKLQTHHLGGYTASFEKAVVLASCGQKIDMGVRRAHGHDPSKAVQNKAVLLSRVAQNVDGTVKVVCPKRGYTL